MLVVVVDFPPWCAGQCKHFEATRVAKARGCPANRARPKYLLVCVGAARRAGDASTDSIIGYGRWLLHYWVNRHVLPSTKRGFTWKDGPSCDVTTRSTSERPSLPSGAFHFHCLHGFVYTERGRFYVCLGKELFPLVLVLLQILLQVVTAPSLPGFGFK